MKKLTHDEIVDSLEKRLKQSGKYNEIISHDYYGSGEIDLYAKTFVNEERRYLIFEVKSNDTIKGRSKARQQLLRARGHCRGAFKKAYLFYVYGIDNDRGYNVERVR